MKYLSKRKFYRLLVIIKKNIYIKIILDFINNRCKQDQFRGPLQPLGHSFSNDNEINTINHMSKDELEVLKGLPKIEYNHMCVLDRFNYK